MLDIEKELKKSGEKPMTNTTKRRALAQIPLGLVWGYESSHPLLPRFFLDYEILKIRLGVFQNPS